MESRKRTFAARSLVGFMGLFSAAAALPQTLYFKDRTRTTDYRFDINDGIDYDATDYFQLAIDALNNGTCGADTSNITCIPRYYDLIKRWHFSTQWQTGPAALYRGAGQTLIEAFEECLKFLINISDANYQQHLDQQAAEQANREQTGSTILYIGFGIIALIVVGAIIAATIVCCRGSKQQRPVTSEVADVEKDDAQTVPTLTSS